MSLRLSLVDENWCILNGCFLILLLNSDRVGALRIDSSVLFHNLRSDGKNDDSNEHNRAKGISKFRLYLKL